MTGNLIVDTREKNRRAIDAVGREWAALTGGGGVCERGLGLSGADWALEVEDGGAGSGQFSAWPEARVESKWLGQRGPGDLFATVTQDRDRFARELARLETQHPYSMVLIEGKHSDIRAHHTPGGLSWAGGVSEAVLTLATRHRVPWLFTERAPLALAVFMQRAGKNDEMERLALDIPRPVIVCEDLERLAIIIESAEPIIRGAQFVVGESAPSDPAALAIICDDLQRAAAGFWFLDGVAMADLEAFAARFRVLEARETAMRAAGGIPAAPASYTGPLPTWDTWRAPDSPRKKRGLVVAFNEDGAPFLLRGLARGSGSAVEVLRAPADLASITRLGDAELLTVIALVEDAALPERDLLPRVVARCRELWGGGAPDVLESSATPAAPAAPAPVSSPEEAAAPLAAPALLDAISMLTAALDRALTQTIPYIQEAPTMAQNNNDANTNALAIRAGMPITDLGAMLVKSGFFGVHSDPAKGQAQAVVKLMFGQELGIAPMAAMTGIHVIEGKPSIGANLIASTIKRSGRYEYRVIRHDHEGCEIAFIERPATELGRYSFTMRDAEAAGLAGKGNWAKHPRSMLFARCIGQGYRVFMPDVFGCEVYADGEIDPQPEQEPKFVEARVVAQTVAPPHAPTPASDHRQSESDNAGAAAGGGVDVPAAAPVESLIAATAAEEAAYIETKQPDVDHRAAARREAVSRAFVAANVPLVIEEGLVQQVFGGPSAATWRPSEQDANEAMGAAVVIGALLKAGLAIEEACPLWAGAVDEDGLRITHADAERFANDLTPRLLNLVERSGSHRIANLDRVALRSECEDLLKSMCSAVPF